MTIAVWWDRATSQWCATVGARGDIIFLRSIRFLVPVETRIKGVDEALDPRVPNGWIEATGRLVRSHDESAFIEPSE